MQRSTLPVMMECALTYRAVATAKATVQTDLMKETATIYYQETNDERRYVEEFKKKFSSAKKPGNINENE